MSVQRALVVQESAMGVSSEFVEFVCEQLGALGEIEARAMMGGRTLYCDGTIFALIDDDQLYIKVNDATLPKFLGAGSSLFAPFKDQPGKTMRYARLPDDALDDREAMLAWARLGVEAGVAGSPRRGKVAVAKKVRKKVAKTVRAGKKKASKAASRKTRKKAT